MARTLTTLPAVLGSSRIMHYLLMQFFAQAAQNGVAISDEPEARRDVERQLLRWLSSYWNRKDDRPHAPLHDLLVRINPVDDQSECWLMVAHLLPAWKGGGELPVSGRFAARVPALRRAQSQLEPGPTRASWLQRLLKRST